MKINIRTIAFAMIIVICIIAINFGIYWQFFRKEKIEGLEDETNNNVVSNEQLVQNFDNIFGNTINKQGNEVKQIRKIEEKEDIIYTKLKKEENSEGKYEIKVNIPCVNIQNSLVEKFNKRVDNIFTQKAEEIIEKANSNTIYNVEYTSYINSNILSLIIRATLKEGNNPQRVIIQTYNYNLSTNEELTLEQILEIKKMSTASVEKEIKSVVSEANMQAMSLKELGYPVYSRNVESTMYKIENTTTYFIGENGKLYILYPYGNSNFTSELDIVII